MIGVRPDRVCEYRLLSKTLGSIRSGIFDSALGLELWLVLVEEQIVDTWMVDFPSHRLVLDQPSVGGVWAKHCSGNFSTLFLRVTGRQRVPMAKPPFQPGAVSREWGALSVVERADAPITGCSMRGDDTRLGPRITSAGMFLPSVALTCVNGTSRHREEYGRDGDQENNRSPHCCWRR